MFFLDYIYYDRKFLIREFSPVIHSLNKIIFLTINLKYDKFSQDYLIWIDYLSDRQTKKDYTFDFFSILVWIHDFSESISSVYNRFFNHFLRICSGRFILFDLALRFYLRYLNLLFFLFWLLLFLVLDLLIWVWSGILGGLTTFRLAILCLYVWSRNWFFPEQLCYELCSIINNILLIIFTLFILFKLRFRLR